MRPLKKFSLVLAAIAATGLVVSGIGFGSVSAERGVQIAVVNDSEAFVGYQSGDHENVESNGVIGLVTVTNRFTTPISVTDVTVNSRSSDVEIVDPTTPENIAPGDSSKIEGTVASCTYGSSSTVTTTVTIEGTGIRATLFGDGETVKRSFTVECASPVESVRFYGTGTVRISGQASSVMADIVLLEKQSNSIMTVDDTELAVGDSIRDQINLSDRPNNVTVIGVGLRGESGYYVHPQFNSTSASCTLDSPNEGGNVTEPTETSWNCPDTT